MMRFSQNSGKNCTNIQAGNININQTGKGNVVQTGNNQSMSISSDGVIINGKVLVDRDGKKVTGNNITVINDRVMVDGKDLKSIGYKLIDIKKPKSGIMLFLDFLKEKFGL